MTTREQPEYLRYVHAMQNELYKSNCYEVGQCFCLLRQINCQDGRKLSQVSYLRRVAVVAIDEAHYISEWLVLIRSVNQCK